MVRISKCLTRYVHALCTCTGFVEIGEVRRVVFRSPASPDAFLAAGSSLIFGNESDKLSQKAFLMASLLDRRWAQSSSRVGNLRYLRPFTFGYGHIHMFAGSGEIKSLTPLEKIKEVETKYLLHLFIEASGRRALERESAVGRSPSVGGNLKWILRDL
jgi:hypothetical protein